ncbi:hypothetical protein NDU88_011904 [Pleurodeles waltl]|uniref:Uncharacterized protein n=1 Tax=Pleurodeles waltl TaxID=8319 RepID=A0AAV7S5N5_PLEWA|nr:hypothetical protein NDU88_011904 [Pleurodeles waltl]
MLHRRREDESLPGLSPRMGPAGRMSGQPAASSPPVCAEGCLEAPPGAAASGVKLRSHPQLSWKRQHLPLGQHPVTPRPEETALKLRGASAALHWMKRLPQRLEAVLNTRPSVCCCSLSLAVSCSLFHPATLCSASFLTRTLL